MAEISGDPEVKRSAQGDPLATEMGKPTILVVDDQEMICMLLKQLFELRGFTVVTAQDLNGATEILNDPGKRITVAIVDGDLGDGCGLQSSACQLTKALRERGIGFVRYSATVSDIPLEERGMAAYLKPYQQSQMVQVLTDSYLPKTE